MSQIRRRQIGGKAGGIPIEHPDYFYFNRETTTDNQDINLGYYVKNHIKDLIIDGEQYPIESIVSSITTDVTIQKAGVHDIYIKIDPVWSNRFFRIENCKSIIRLPFNSSQSMNGSAGFRCTFATEGGEIFCLDSVPTEFRDSDRPGPKASVIYIPKGSYSAYEAHADWGPYKSKFVEVDYKYTIPNE